MEIRKHPTGPVPKWGLYFYWGAVLPAWVLTAPFMRLTLMPVTESSRNSYLFLDSFFHGEPSHRGLYSSLSLVVVLTTLTS